MTTFLKCFAAYLLMAHVALRAADDSASRNTDSLKGVHSVSVTIVVSQNPPGILSESSVRGQFEQFLQQNCGLRIDSANPDAEVRIAASAIALPPGKPSYILVGFRTSVWRKVILATNTTVSYTASAWSYSTLASLDKNLDIKPTLVEHLTQLQNDFRAVGQTAPAIPIPVPLSALPLTQMNAKLQQLLNQRLLATGIVTDSHITSTLVIQNNQLVYTLAGTVTVFLDLLVETTITLNPSITGSIDLSTLSILGPIGDLSICLKLPGIDGLAPVCVKLSELR